MSCSSPAPPSARSCAARITRCASSAARPAGRPAATSSAPHPSRVTTCCKSKPRSLLPACRAAARRRRRGLPRPRLVGGERLRARAAARRHVRAGPDRGHAAIALRRRAKRRRPSTASRTARSCAGRSLRTARRRSRARARRELLVRTLVELRCRGDRRRRDLGPARDALRAPARRRARRSRRSPGSRTTSPTRWRRPRSASWRRSPASRRSASRSRTCRPNLVTLGDVFDDLPHGGQPAVRVARQGHLRQRGLDRPRPDAAPADRRHDRLGQVGLPEHDADLDPAARDPRRGADDHDRPEADRARLLRVDPAPAHAGRLEPEAGRRCADQRRGGDGAPLRAHEPDARSQPPGDEPLAARARHRDAPVPARRHRRARRPDDDLAAGGRGRGDPARAEVARRRHPPRARDAAARPWT